MRCVSCETEIDPKWAHAINNNICPYCGKIILEEHLKNIHSFSQVVEQEMNKTIMRK